MDPKTLASLDPKLRETYERVMGNSGNSPTLTPAADNTSSATPFPLTDTIAMTSPAIPSAPSIPTTEPSPLPTTPPLTTTNPFEVVNPNPALPDTTGTLNPDGLSSAFPTPQAPTADSTTPSTAVPGLDMTSPFAVTTPPTTQEPFPVAGSNMVDTTSFTLNPMGQKTDAGTIGNTPIEPITPTAPNTAPPLDQSASAFSAIPAKTSPLLKILYIAAAIIFFVIYTFIWLKLFKFPLPF